VRIGFCAPIFSVALVVPSFRLRERHRASGSRASQGQPGPARASQGQPGLSQGDREGWVNEDGASPKGGSVGSKHEETVIVQAQDNISTVTFPTSEVYKASCGAARTIVGA
jgi:hypothetical protein